MYNIKNKLALVALLALSFTGTTFAASGDTTGTGTADQFAMKEVSVVDAKTLKISFTKDLLEDTSMFEFLLTPKSDDTKEVALTGITLAGPTDVTATTLEDLQANQEYNLVVVFASDKEGKLIENGVDGMITFKTPETFAAAPVVEAQPMDAAPVATDATATPTEAVPAEVQPMDAAAQPTDASGVTAQPTDVAAANAEALPQTGPAEMMVVLLALLMGLGFMYTRRRA